MTPMACNTKKIQTILETFAAPEVSARRRYQDFVWLHRTLSEEYPACILPPLPGKHRMEYITGDRFSPQFIEKRRASLQTFLERIGRHPTLQRSAALKKFLEAADLQHVATTTKPKETVFENLGDVFLNAFSKVKKPDDRFVEFKESIDKFEENLSTVEKLHSKLLRQQMDLEQDLAEFEGCIGTLGVMETQITQPLAEFANTVRNVCGVLTEKVGVWTWRSMLMDFVFMDDAQIQRDDVDYVTSLHEYIAYCQSVKDVLKTRDQKQVDYEELTSYLQNHMVERERTMVGRSAGGVASFIKDKYNEFRQVDQEKARQTKLAKLETKITELQEAVQQSQEISVAFSSEVSKEVDLLQSVKVADFKNFLRDYADSQLEFYEKGLRYWEEILPILETMGSEDSISTGDGGGAPSAESSTDAP
ncbi:intercellular trafficking and secretion [Borealophlyctis nickersoniae]|nr:intercellular trafficking and secretion [Borealophlyctis nickersoniae]